MHIKTKVTLVTFTTKTRSQNVQRKSSVLCIAEKID